MKYEKIEQIQAKKIADEKLLDELVETYIGSDSMAEFKLKASAAGHGKSKYMKWFSLFYFAKNHSVYAEIPWFISVPPAILFTIAGGIGINCMAEISKSGGWQLLCAMIFIACILIGIAGAVFLYRKINGILENINEKIWRRA